MSFKLTEIKEPEFEVDFGGEIGVKSYDPWKVQQIVGTYGINHPDASVYEAVREAFGFKPDDEMITRNHCHHLSEALQSFIDGLPITKKLNARTANSLKSA